MRIANSQSAKNSRSAYLCFAFILSISITQLSLPVFAASSSMNVKASELQLYKDSISDNAKTDATLLPKLEKSLLSDPENLSLLNIRAITNAQMMHLELSLQDFKTIAEKKNDWVSYYNLGYIYLLQNNYQNSISALDQSIELNDESPLALTLSAEVRRLNLDEEGSKADYDKVLKISPNNHNAMTLQANSLYNSGQYDAADAMITKAIKLNRSPYNFFLKGMIDNANKDWNSAKANLNVGIKASNSAALLYIARGITSIGEGNPNKAISDFDMAIKNGLHVRGLIFKGIAQYQSKDYAAAEETLREALANNTTNPIAYSYLAKCLARKGDLVEAEMNFIHSIKANPRDPELYNNYAWFLLVDKQDNLGSLEQFSQALLREKNNPVYYLGRASAYYEMGEFDIALKDLDTSITLDKDFAVAYHKRADAKFKLSLADQAWEDAERACKLGEKLACR